MIEAKGYLLFLLFLLFLPFFIQHLLSLKKYFTNNKNFNFNFGIKSIINLFLRIIVFILVVIALAGPLVPDKTSKKFGSGMNTIFIVDISKSMNCEDVKPSRLEYAKTIINEFIDSCFYDKTGIILFADKSIFYCPLTSDQEALKTFVNNITTDLIPSGGSSLKSGLERAFNVLNKKKIKGNTVLISDGEDLEKEDLNDILAKYKEKKIRIYTIGVGTKKGGKIPYYVEFFFKKKYYKKYHGKTVITKLNEQILLDIASKTGGKYFKYSEINGKKLYKKLKLTSYKTKNKKYFYMTKNIYYVYLTAAFIIFLISLILMWI